MGNKRTEYYGKEQKDYVVSLIKDQGYSATKAAQLMFAHFGLERDETVERSYRKIVQKLKLSVETSPVEDTDEFKTAQARTFDNSKNKFIVSYAQAETPIHEQFLTNMEAYAKFIDAGLHIICGRYKNPTSLDASKHQEAKDKDKRLWDARLTPYLDANRQNIHKYLTILGDIKIQPTASTPLSGLNGITSLESCIIGHPRVHLKSLAVLDGYPKKLLLSTGAVTLENYTDTKAGKKGEFHHTLGFIIVELDGDIFHIRQVQCDNDGSFYDLGTKVVDGQILNTMGETYPAIVLGDIHLGYHDEASVELSLKMARRFSVEDVVLHDIFDGKSISHHELLNPFLQLENEQTGKDDLYAEIDRTVQFIKSNKDLNFVVVRSNHDDFLDRWLINSDWRKQANKAAYLTMAGILASGKADKGIIPYYIDEACPNAITLGLNDSYRIKNWELAIHGHIGQNGSRGSVTQFKGLNTKTITGHTHTPIREDGHQSVGMLTVWRMGYNNGASSWMRSNILIYPNGKTSHIHITNGKYTTIQ